MANSVTGVAPFTTIQYEKNGQNLTATKNNGIVTITNEKGETRQMPIREFFTTEFPKGGALEKSPEKDTVEITTKENPAVKSVRPESKPIEDTPVSIADVKKAEAAATPVAEAKTADLVGKKLDVAA